MMTWQDVETLKVAHRYRHAGQLAAILGYGPDYGCHYGMRDTRDIAVQAFRLGYNEGYYAMTHGDDGWLK